jgi:hypothetical protein
MKSEFIDSAYGQALLYRTRQRRSFDFWWTGTLQTKKSRRPVDDRLFQTELLAQMERLGRKGPYTGPVLLEFQFLIESDRSPSIQNLTKHYLDLLMSPVDGVALRRSKIVLRDDSQVKFLSCTYNHILKEDGLRLRVRRLSDFFEDLKLYDAILSGTFHDRFEAKDEDADEFTDDRHLEDWRDLQKRKDEWIQCHGEQAYKSFELLNRRLAQQEVLRRRSLPLRVLSDLFGGRHHPLRHYPDMTQIIQSTVQMTRTTFLHQVVTIDFGPRPLLEGDTDRFKAKVRRELQEYKQRIPFLFPLLTASAITIIYLPPKEGTKVDLDNLARKAIIPAVHEIMEPPATSATYWRALQQAQPNDQTVLNAIDQYKRSPKVHVSGYEVLCVDRLADDPPNGSVKLLLHSGDPTKTPLTRLERILDKWEDQVERH